MQSMERSEGFDRGYDSWTVRGVDFKMVSWNVFDLGIYLRADEYKNLTQNENYQVSSVRVLRCVCVVEGTIFPKSIPKSKHHRTKWVQSNQFPAFVITADVMIFLNRED